MRQYTKAKVVHHLSKIGIWYSNEGDLPAFEWYVAKFPNDTDYTKLYRSTKFLRFMYEDDVTYGWRDRIEGAKTDIEKGELLSEAYQHYNDVMDQEAELREEREKASLDMFYF